MDKHRIDLVAHDDLPYPSSDCEDVYKFVKDQGKFLATERLNLFQHVNSLPGRIRKNKTKQNKKQKTNTNKLFVIIGQKGSLLQISSPESLKITTLTFDEIWKRDFLERTWTSASSRNRPTNSKIHSRLSRKRLKITPRAYTIFYSTANTHSEVLFFPLLFVPQISKPNKIKQDFLTLFGSQRRIDQRESSPQLVSDSDSSPWEIPRE